MDPLSRLPPELFLMIFEYVLDNEYLWKGARYAPVSRQFQYFVERRGFESLDFTNACLDTVERLFRPAQAHRKAFVRTIFFRIELPDYSFEDSTRRETEDEQEANSRIFSDAVHGLFRVLKSLDESEDLRNAGGLHLRFRAPDSKGDRRYNNVDDEKRGSIRGKRSRASLLRVRDAEKLPTVSIVGNLYLGGWHGDRYADPLSTMAIATKLDRFQRSRIVCYDKDYLDIATRRMNRLAIAQSLSSFPHPMDELDLDFSPTSGYSESYNTPNLLDPSSPGDTLALAAHRLIQRAKLREGHWYFMEDPAIASHAEFVGEENADVDHDSLRAEDVEYNTENSFRTLPDPERVNPLLIAMARAIQHAPVLGRVYLCLDDTNRKLNPKYLANHGELDLRRSFELDYYAAGVHRYGEDKTRLPKRARAFWQVGDWRPDEEVQRAWRDAMGPDGLMIFEDVKVPPSPEPYAVSTDSDDDSDEDSEEGTDEGSDGGSGERSEGFYGISDEDSEDVPNNSNDDDNQN